MDTLYVIIPSTEGGIPTPLTEIVSIRANIEINLWRSQKKQEYHQLVRQSPRVHTEAGFHYEVVLLCRNKPLWELEGNYGLSPLKYIYSLKVKILHTLFT